MLFISNISCFAVSNYNQKIYNFKYSHSKWNGKKFDALIFEGGGTRAVVYSGTLKKLEEENMINNINSISGTSSGAQTAALLCVGYNSTDLECILRKAPWDKILHGNIFNIKCIYSLLNKFGLNNGKYLEKYLDELIYLKSGSRQLTFIELYNRTKIHLKIGVCSLTDQEFKYIDHISYPDMPISIGLRASSSIPFIFSRTKWKDELFIDGGLIGNLPITSFPKKKCLAFTLSSKNEYDFQIKKNPKNIFGFIRVILSILFRNVQKNYSSENKCYDNIDYIQINTDDIGILEKNMSNDTINKLINHGYNAVNDFLNN